MPVEEHLEELRRRLFIFIIALFFALLALFPLSGPVFKRNDHGRWQADPIADQRQGRVDGGIVVDPVGKRRLVVRPAPTVDIRLQISGRHPGREHLGVHLGACSRAPAAPARTLPAAGARWWPPWR